MSATKYTNSEVAERGEALFEREIRDKIGPGHDGDFVVMDIETGEYEIAPDDLTATKRLMNRCPDAVIYGMRIGHSAAYRLGGFSKVRDS